MTGRHRASGPAAGPLNDAVRRVQALTVVAAVAGLTVAAGAPASAAGFSDTAVNDLEVRAYTVPAATQGAGQSAGTGYLIDTRLQVSCDDFSTPLWRFRDRVSGGEWHGWLPWSAEQSDPGFTAWVTSGLGYVGVTVETQWEVQCTTGTWTGISQTSAPIPITRTT